MSVPFDVESIGLDEWQTRAERMTEALRVEVARAETPSIRKALAEYLEAVAPCLPALAHATLAAAEPTLPRPTAERACCILATIYESIVAFGDEIRLVLLDGRPSELAMLPDLLALACTEREELADLVRANRPSSSRCARVGASLQSLAVTLVTVRVQKRAA